MRRGGLPTLIVIAGATATGKTRLSLRLAAALGNVEIISADSRQVMALHYHTNWIVSSHQLSYGE